MTLDLSPDLLVEWMAEEDLLDGMSVTVNNHSELNLRSIDSPENRCQLFASITAFDEIFLRLGAATPYTLSGALPDLKPDFVSLVTAVRGEVIETVWWREDLPVAAKMVFSDGSRLSWRAGLTRKFHSTKVDYHYSSYPSPQKFTG